MKVVVIGGTGLIGSKVVSLLTQHGHTAVAAAPNTGVNTLTGEGLAQVLEGAAVVVDVSNSPSFEDKAVLEFFQTSTRNLLKYEAEAGVVHHVALSVVGAERLPDSGYLRAKVAQEQLIERSSIPYSIVHATQFFEFAKRIAAECTINGVVRVPSALIQPMASDDVARAVAQTAVAAPLRATLEIGGPDALSFAEFLGMGLRADNDLSEIVVDASARYFGTKLDERSLLPGPNARLSQTSFKQWLTQQRKAA